MRRLFSAALITGLAFSTVAGLAACSNPSAPSAAKPFPFSVGKKWSYTVSVKPKDVETPVTGTGSLEVTKVDGAKGNMRFQMNVPPAPAFDATFEAEGADFFSSIGGKGKATLGAGVAETVTVGGTSYQTTKYTSTDAEGTVLTYWVNDGTGLVKMTSVDKDQTTTMEISGQ